MKPVLTLRHVPHETLGTLREHIAVAGLESQYLDLFDTVPDRLAPEDWSAMVVLGGPMNADEADKYPYLAPEVEWIRRAVDARMPVLGICLGSQLVAKALGSRVYANGTKEIGWYPVELLPAAQDDPLFAGCEPSQTVFQWHGDTFDLPDGAVHLARGEACENQAFRYGECAWGLQFHIEVTEEMVNAWLDEPENQRELAGLDDIDPEAIREGIAENLAPMQILGDRILPRFVTLARRRA